MARDGVIVPNGPKFAEEIEEFLGGHVVAEVLDKERSELC